MPRMEVTEGTGTESTEATGTKMDRGTGTGSAEATGTKMDRGNRSDLTQSNEGTGTNREEGKSLVHTEERYLLRSPQLLCFSV
jgi:hypothetical protein